jgi:hypothetical protein
MLLCGLFEKCVALMSLVDLGYDVPLWTCANEPHQGLTTIGSPRGSPCTAHEKKRRGIKGRKKPPPRMLLAWVCRERNKENEDEQHIV